MLCLLKYLITMCGLEVHIMSIITAPTAGLQNEEAITLFSLSSKTSTLPSPFTDFDSMTVPVLQKLHFPYFEWFAQLVVSCHQLYGGSWLLCNEFLARAKRYNFEFCRWLPEFVFWS